MHRAVNTLIYYGNVRPGRFNKDGNLEPNTIGVDLDNIQDKLVEESFIIHFHMCLQ